MDTLSPAIHSSLRRPRQGTISSISFPRLVVTALGQPSATQMTVALLVFWLVVAGLAARLESRNRRAV